MGKGQTGSLSHSNLPQPGNHQRIGGKMNGGGKGGDLKGSLVQSNMSPNGRFNSVRETRDAGVVGYGISAALNQQGGGGKR